MKELTPQDVAHIAAGIRLTGELLEQHGTRALHATESWQVGPSSANLEPTRGHRSEQVNFPEGEAVVPIPNDRTGEAAIGGDPYATTTKQLVHLLTIIDDASSHLRRILYAACPQATQPNVFEPDTPAQISAAGWCVSCHRDGGYCEPVSMRPDGTRRYRDYCTWCGEFIATQERNRPAAKKKRKKDQTAPKLPPIELIKARHRGDRITKQMVDALTQKKAS